jgi:hypothetical protein
VLQAAGRKVARTRSPRRRCPAGAHFGTGADEAQAKRARDLARALATALDLTDDSHYGTLMVGATELRRLIRAAEVLVSAAVEVT